MQVRSQAALRPEVPMLLRGTGRPRIPPGTALRVTSQAP